MDDMTLYLPDSADLISLEVMREVPVETRRRYGTSEMYRWENVETRADVSKHRSRLKEMAWKLVDNGEIARIIRVKVEDRQKMFDAAKLNEKNEP